MSETRFIYWDALLEQITSETPLQLIEEIKNATALRNIVELCYNSSTINKMLREWLVACLQRPSSIRSAELATNYRLTGNTYCEEKKYAVAIKYYNKSLMYALKDSDEMRSAYGNRSHALLLMNQFEDAIRDIDRALSNDTVVLRQIKLSMRKGEAYLGLRKYKEATDILHVAADLIRSLDSNLQKRTLKTLQQVDKLLRIVSDEMKNGRAKPNMFRKWQEEENSIGKEPSLNFVENPTFRCASKSISLMRSKEKGRFVVTNEEVKVGDVLFAERPFAFVILPDMIEKYCSHCCKRMVSIVPCLNCPLAAFCNEECREAAMKSTHEWECGGLDVCYSIGIVHLSLRVALLGILKENKEKYAEVQELVSHIEDLETADLFNYAITATLLILYLEEHTALFKKERKRKDKLMELGANILLHIGQLVCNGHAITDIQSTEVDESLSVVLEDQVRVATAIYPSASMMNHSCEPSIINSFFDALLIVRSAKNLKKGDQVYNCYGPTVHNTGYKQRQEDLLNQYFFTCDCEVCERKEGPKTDTLICKHCSSEIKPDITSCAKCSNQIDMKALLNDLKESDKLFQRGVAELNQCEYEKSRTLFAQALDLRKLHCHKNHKKMMDCRDFLARACATLGKEEDAYYQLVVNLYAIQEVFGEVSIELGQEIIKVVSLVRRMCDKSEISTERQRKILEECLEFGKKGKFIFTLCYGDWHTRYHEMQRAFDYISFHLRMYRGIV